MSNTSKSSQSSRSYRGHQARQQDATLKSWTVGALPIINRILDQMRLDDILQEHLPSDGSRMKVPTRCCLQLLVRNMLISREPMYGIGEWAECYVPQLLGLTPEHLTHLNDDRVGRALDRLFDTDSAMLLALVRHVIDQFDISLTELHNDSTTVTFSGAYQQAEQEAERRSRKTLAITHGHNKDHRPDLKQLLYILTVSDDGGVPIYFTTASGNVTDDQTHQRTWDLLRELIGSADFLYVADCKLATTENMRYIARHQGRFISVLPRSRKEDTTFRERLLKHPDDVRFNHLDTIEDDYGRVTDVLSMCADKSISAEGFRLCWYHSTRKAQRDATTRARGIQRCERELNELRDRLRSPKTRFRTRKKVQQAVDEILARLGNSAWMQVEIHELPQDRYRQKTRGRPGKDTEYVKEVSMRYGIQYQVDPLQVAMDTACDGVFPLITNDDNLSDVEVLRAYKRQPIIEKRFSQFKTDYEVAPVWLKDVGRIQSLLCLYFFALMVQTLLERELRQAMDRDELDSLPFYPEGRECKMPTTRRLIDLFQPVQRHELSTGGEPTTFVTELTKPQRQTLKLLGVAQKTYGR